MLATNENKYSKIVKEAETSNNLYSLFTEGTEHEKEYNRFIIFDIMNREDKSRSNDIDVVSNDKAENLSS